MPHATVRLRPGVNQTDTPTLNEAGVSESQLIRYFYDPILGAIIQKLGGWIRFFPNQMVSIVRALWAWEDTNANAHLAVGCENIGMSGSAQLSVITNGNLLNITPTSSSTNTPPLASTTAASSTVTITDATTPGITSFDSVYIETHISVGGLVLFGLYATTLNSATSYLITARDVLGNPLPATSTSSTATVAEFTTTMASAVVKVTLNNHGYNIGSTYPILISTTVDGITLFGNYLVISIIDANNFTINASQIATASTSAFINGGDAAYIYSYGIGAVPTGTGYGIGGYGLGGYGVGTAITPAVGTPIAATDWTLDNFGEILIACPINGTLFQPIYQYDPLSGAPIASVISTAPPLNDGIFVAMPQRQIVAWGSTETGIQDPLLIRWSDAGNLNVWVGQITNQAGSFRIPKGSKIIGCMQAPQQGLIWTDLGVWSMQYIGPDLVYSFNEIGSGCGMIARKAAGSLNGIVYWMGPSQFFMLGGDGVSPIACPVWDVIFQNLDQTNLTKIRVAANSRFGEISWFYPSLSGGGEVDSYVKYNTYLQAWDYGTLGRSAWIDQSVLGPPIGADPQTLFLYQHETSPNADGQPLLSNFTTGYYSIGDGDMKTYVDQIWPDFKYGTFNSVKNATVNLTFNVTDYPGQTPQTFGPYAMTQSVTWLSPRFRGRLVSLNISSSDIDSFWRIGALRYRYSPDGKF